MHGANGCCKCTVVVPTELDRSQSALTVNQMVWISWFGVLDQFQRDLQSNSMLASTGSIFQVMHSSGGCPLCTEGVVE